MLKRVLSAYDRLFGFSMPYAMAVHHQPARAGNADVTHLHLERSPPYRTATKRKFPAGSEPAGSAYVTDLAPELTAATVRLASLCEALGLGREAEALRSLVP